MNIRQNKQRGQYPAVTRLATDKGFIIRIKNAIFFRKKWIIQTGLASVAGQTLSIQVVGFGSGNVHTTEMARREFSVVENQQG